MVGVGLAAGNRVHSSRGAIPIENVRECKQVMAADGYTLMTGWFDRGIQEVVEILTESGTLFRCTPNHGVAVLADVWGGHASKNARDLTPKDRLLFITRAIDGASQPLLPLPDQRVSDHGGSTVHQPALDIETACLQMDTSRSSRTISAASWATRSSPSRAGRKRSLRLSGQWRG